MAIEFLQRETEFDNLPEHLLRKLSFSSRQDFPTSFQELNQTNRERAIRACILHLSEKGVDDLGAQMVPWLAATDRYLSAVLDPEFLSLESAKRVCSVFRTADPYFFAHLSRLAFNTQKPHLSRHL